MSSAFAQATEQGAEPTIRWRVENPFRLFLDPEDTNMHRELFKSLTEQEKQNPVLSTERRLARTHEHGWAEKVFRKTCWDETRNRYRFCRDKGIHYINPKRHKVLVNLSQEMDRTDTCDWSLLSLRKKRVKRKYRVLARRTAPCNEEVAFNIPWPRGARVEARRSGTLLGARSIKVEDLFIVGLGDSFASGEGNPDDPVRFTDKRGADYGLSPNKQLLAGYPARRGDWSRIGDGAFLREAARWQSRACHRSLYSHQTRAALQLAIENPHRAITYVSFACSGSEITIGLFLRYKGNEWTKNPPQLPQLSYIAEEQCGRQKTTPKDYVSGYSQLGKLPELENMVLNKCYKKHRKIDLLMLSIGGNDVGFASLLANAVMRDKSLLKKVGGWVGSVHKPKQARAKLETLKIRYKALRKALHYMLKIPWKEADRVLLTAYPRMERQEDGASYCKAGSDGMSLYPDFAVMRNKLKQGAAFADELYNVMKSRAQKFGWTFVDEHRDLFASHGFCASNPYDTFGHEEELALPRLVDGRWVPFRPSRFRPYASRQRWFRTPNDAYLTSHFHTHGLLTRGLMKSSRAKWFQLVLAGTYSGSFHPTAEGHAAIADAVVRKARKILVKYNR